MAFPPPSPSPSPSPSPASEASLLFARAAKLRAEIAALTSLLAEQEAEERDAQRQIESLTYATDLTRDEAARRAHANAELSTAYSRAPAPAREDRSVATLHKLEHDLFNAKSAAASATFEVEQVEFRLKKIRDETAPGPGGRGRGGLPPDVSSPPTPVMRSSPQIASLSNRNMSKRKMSPLVRPARLIGDVDCLVAFAGAEGEARQPEDYAPCRLGVTASGHMAAYSYGSAVPQLELDDRSARTGELGEGDMEALGQNLGTVDLQIGANKYWLCGLGEAMTASMQLVQDASNVLKTDDEEVEVTGGG